MDSRRRQLLFAWRLAAAWLLVVCVIAGPLGLGAAIASVKTCGASCPCDDEHASEDGDHAGERNSDAQHEDAHDADHHDDGRGDADCPKDCPDDCPDCGCCSGVMVAVVPLTMPSVHALYDSLTAPSSPRAPPLGAAFDVYRPPRSRA